MNNFDKPSVLKEVSVKYSASSQTAEPAAVEVVAWVNNETLKSVHAAKLSLTSVWLSKCYSDEDDTALITLASHNAVVEGLRGEVERLQKDAGAEMFLTLTGEITTLRTELERANALLAAIGLGCQQRETPSEHQIGKWAEAIDAHISQQANP